MAMCNASLTLQGYALPARLFAYNFSKNPYELLRPLGLNMDPSTDGGVSMTPDLNTPAKVSRYKWEPYRDIDVYIL